MEIKYFTLELENASVFYLNVFSMKEAVLKALLRSGDEGSEIMHLTNNRTGRKISNISLDYDLI